MSEFKVVSDFPLILTNKILNMYNYFSSDRNDEHNMICTYNGFADFMKTANDKVYINGNTFNENEELIQTIEISDSKDIIVGYSSGFDSTYQALKFMDMGYNVILFHCNNLNKSYPDEKIKAKEFSDYYNMKLVCVDIEHSEQFFIDNPVKNQLILSMMIDYGIANSINNFALGNNIYENIKECRSQYGISDSIENFNLFRKGINKYIKNINFYDINIRKHECYKYVAENHFEAFEFVNSCISPHRFKKSLNKHNTDKYGISPLSKERCMSCYKCAIEYIVLSKYGFVELNVDYLKHCYEVIRKKSDTIFTTKISNKKSTNEEIERNIFNA